jgi:hypothetical protein
MYPRARIWLRTKVRGSVGMSFLAGRFWSELDQHHGTLVPDRAEPANGLTASSFGADNEIHSVMNGIY